MTTKVSMVRQKTNNFDMIYGHTLVSVVVSETNPQKNKTYVKN